MLLLLPFLFLLLLPLLLQLSLFFLMLLLFMFLLLLLLLFLLLLLQKLFAQLPLFVFLFHIFIHLVTFLKFKYFGVNIAFPPLTRLPVWPLLEGDDLLLVLYPANLKHQPTHATFKLPLEMIKYSQNEKYT